VLDSWDAAEDSEVEREKERKAKEAKEKATAEAAASKKSKAQRIKEHQDARAKALAEESDEDEDETEAERRERLRATEKEADMKHAEALFGDGDDFGDIGVSNSRKGQTVGTAVAISNDDPSKTVNIANLPLFNPTTKAQFENLRTTLVPILAANGKKAHYSLFLQEFAKQLAAELPSDQIKIVASKLTALSSEKLKAEKAAQKGGKKTKAAKTKTSLVASRANTTDTNAYDNDDFGEYVAPTDPYIPNV
jgi:translation initiation factor 3 subunit J